MRAFKKIKQMNRLSKLATATWLLAFGLATISTQATEPLYQNDFEKTEVGEVPDDFLVLDGGFEVKAEDG